VATFSWAPAERERDREEERERESRGLRWCFLIKSSFILPTYAVAYV